MVYQAQSINKESQTKLGFQYQEKKLKLLQFFCLNQFIDTEREKKYGLLKSCQPSLAFQGKAFFLYLQLIVQDKYQQEAQMEKSYEEIVPINIGSLVTAALVKTNSIEILEQKIIVEEIMVADQKFDAKVSTPKKNNGKKKHQIQLQEADFDNLAPNTEQNIDWRPEEEQKLYELYAEKGSKWVQITKYFSQRPPNYLKNKFYGSVRKLVRKLNTFGKNKMRMKNYLKEISVVRPLQFSVQKFESLFGGSAPLIQLKEKIMSALKLGTLWQMQSQGVWLIQNINKFNLDTRSYYAKKKLPKISNMYINRKKVEIGLLQNIALENFDEEIVELNNFSLNLSEIGLPFADEEENSLFGQFKCPQDLKNELRDYTFFEFSQGNIHNSNLWNQEQYISNLDIF